MKGDVCSIIGCNKIVRTGSVCQVHWWRMHKYGSYEKPSRKRFGEICRVDGCEKLRDGRHSVCPMHRSRLSRYKSLDVPIFSYPDGIVHECKIHGLLSREKAYQNPKGNHYSCIQCRRDNDKKFFINNPDINGNDYKKNHYLQDTKSTKIKINKLDYYLLEKAQNYVCAICKKPESRKNPSKKSKMPIKRLAIDHKHGTTIIRGLLCQLCNTGLGVFKDSIEILQSAIDYLKKHQ